MLTFETFQTYLTSDVKLRPISDGLIADKNRNLRSWSAALSMKPEAEQCNELEKLLGQLVVAQISDAERMTIMQGVFSTVLRVVGQLHQHYIYEVSIISASQHNYANKVKSLLFLSVLIFEGVTKRELARLVTNSEPSKPLFKLRRNTTSASTELMTALFGSIYVYFSLLKEASLLYQRTPKIYWQHLNQCFRTAMAYECTHVDLSQTTPIAISPTIEDLYIQACLHSLLGLSSYRRQDIVGVHKLLPLWSKEVKLTDVADAQYRLFVDLDSDAPPMHLTPYSKINPYEEDKNCIFINLQTFEKYLQNLVENATRNPQMATQIRLAKMAWHTLTSSTGRREERHVSYDRATVVTGFNLIHYYMAGKKPLSTLIHDKKIEPKYLPNYDTQPKSGYASKNLAVQIMDTSTTGCRFRWGLTQEQVAQGGQAAMSNLQVLSLFAMQIHASEQNAGKIVDGGSWHIGLVRWVENRDDIAEAGGRIIGFSATACGIRLETKDTRSQDFVPALLLAGNEKLGSKTTLLLPRYHFRMGDKVILRIGSKQTLLRLHHVLLSSDDFEQFEMLKIQS